MKKDTLSLTKLIQNFKSIIKDRLFYDQYRYCLGFHLSEVSCLRELDHDYIDTVIKRRRQWRQVSLQQWGIGPARNILAHRDREILDETVVNLHTLTDTLLNSFSEFKLVTSVNTAWVYTNDLDLLTTVNDLHFLMINQCTEAVVTRPKDTIKLKDPKHSNRAYLSNIKLTDI